MRHSFILGGLALLLTFTPALAAERAPVVVELFTSEGCSSCPPADAYLGELAKRPGVIALSFHVDYWNRLGWSDPFSSAAATARQKGYAESLKQSYVYTPEMVVDGLMHEAGSRREKMETLIDAARANTVFPVALTRKPGGAVEAVLPAAGGATTDATVWLVLYDRSQTVAVKNGENGGRTITHANVVREIRRVGGWNGQAARLALSIDAATLRERSSGAAVIVQAGSFGTILGAGAIALDGPGA